MKTLRKQSYFSRLLVALFLLSGLVLHAQNPAPPAYFKDKSIAGIGFGFGGGLGGPGISYDLLPGYTGTISPGLMLSYEFNFDKHFGVGAVMSVSSATFTNDNMVYVFDSSGSKINKTFTDKISETLIGLAGKAYYHFGIKGKFDPYGAGIIGYTFTASSSHTVFQQVDYPSHSFYPGILIGVAVGARYYASKQIGIWAEAGYTGVPDYLFNAGVTYTFLAKW